MTESLIWGRKNSKINWTRRVFKKMLAAGIALTFGGLYPFKWCLFSVSSVWMNLGIFGMISKQFNEKFKICLSLFEITVLIVNHLNLKYCTFDVTNFDLLSILSWLRFKEASDVYLNLIHTIRNETSMVSINPWFRMV